MTKLNVIMKPKGEAEITEPQIISKPLLETTPLDYDRNGMMKEVNDIIGELQTMLKPKIIKIQSHGKQNSSDLIPILSLKDCVKDL